MPSLGILKLIGSLLTALLEDSDGENGDGPQQWRGSTPPNMLGRLRDHKPCYHPYLSLQFETLQTPAVSIRTIYLASRQPSGRAADTKIL